MSANTPTPAIGRYAHEAYRLERDGRYRIDNYDRQSAFCSFLPGIGGPAGVPLWCMYVNRAQAVVSYGVQDKDHAIAEFLPATWAYQLVGVQGFRTFCKIDGKYHEPFNAGANAQNTAERTLYIAPEHIELVERHRPSGLKFDVTYFSPVNQPLGALVRRVTISNESSDTQRVKLLDGLPLIIPAGFTDLGLKTLRHIHEAYAVVRLINAHIPFYAGKVVTHDEAEVTRVVHGNFYAAWQIDGNALRPIEPYVDPHVIFGGGQDLVTPRHFIENDAIDRAAQVWENRLPCALAPVEADLAPGQNVSLVALSGFAPDEHLLKRFLPSFAAPADFDNARSASRRLLDDITTPAAMFSNLPLLDGYAQQNYLDNVLRGGVPTALPSREGDTLLHLYARRHGDLERDYNYFVLPPHPLSAGSGNYRDILQNRRCDVWFYPEVFDREIRMFVDLLQPDGYNPLGVEGYAWRCDQRTDPAQLCPTEDADARKHFVQILSRDFQPGELLHWVHQYGVDVGQEQDWLANLLRNCHRTLRAAGHEGGYWVDHWTYIADLLEAYAAVHPDGIGTMLCGSADIGWFDEPAHVVDRHKKYVHRASGWLQLDAVADATHAGAALPRTTVLGKLCALLAIKAVSFDYDGRGIEMEAGRPGWNDSLNGLPGLFGSSTCEAAELARLARWLIEHAPDLPDTELPTVVADLLDRVSEDLHNEEYDWDRAATIREQFRATLRTSGGTETRSIPGAQLRELITRVEQRARNGVDRSVDPQTGLLHTYFVNTPTDDTQSPRSFTAHPLPLYLEGQVHWLRLLDDPQAIRTIHQAVRSSTLFDEKLAMYKLNECLDACPPEIGRARTFTRGWFENESIWLHMSYKYLLELLRAGLYDEFFTDAQTMLVPFMDPQIYGRSVLENSSFLGSSANPDPATHGRGFIARLSGSSAEFIHIYLLLTAGPRPFRIGNNELKFQLSPVLPAEWFRAQPSTIHWHEQPLELPANSLACALLGRTLLVYHNDSRRDTFGSDPAQPVRYQLDDAPPVVAPELTGADAERIRARQCRRLNVWLA